MHENQSNMNDLNYYDEKAPLAPQNETPLTDTEDIKLSHFHQLSTFDKLWVLTQGSALSCCFFVLIASGCTYFTSDLVNCDGRSPYSQALISGLYASMLCMYAWLCAYRLRKSDQALNASNSWSLAARQRRRQRTPIFLAITGSGQYIAAFIHTLVAYRTSRAPLGVNVVYVAATIGVMLCFAAGTSNMYLAMTTRRSKRSDLCIDISEKNDAHTTSSAEESTLLYDTAFASLPAFDKQWLAVHVFALISLTSVAATSSSLLWQIPCGDSARKPLLSLSENSLTPWPQLITMGSSLLQIWLPRVSGSEDNKNQSRFMVVLAQLYFITVGVTMGFSAYLTPNTTYGLALVNLQTGIAGVAFVLCSGYDFALMLKTNFNGSPVDTAIIEEDAGKQGGLNSQ